MTTLGSFLKQKRQEKNLTQKDLAKILFVSESLVSKWEKDVTRPDITLLPKLSNVLGVTEHELITASVDESTRQDKVYAKRWKRLSFSWSLFFYIGYALTLIPCFICDLAINKGLTWFWIVVSALILSFNFTNLPKLIKKHKLIFLPLCMYLALCLLLGVCAIYTNGKWFFIVALSVLLGLVIIFAPIYIAKYKFFDKVKKYNDFVSVFTDFILLNILLIVVNAYTNGSWYLSLALPISFGVYAIINLLLLVRFLKINKLLKTSVILTVITFICYCFTPYFLPLIVKNKNQELLKELSSLEIIKSDFSTWQGGITLERNIHCIIFLTLILLIVIFTVSGLIFRKRKNK